MVFFVTCNKEANQWIDETSKHSYHNHPSALIDKLEDIAAQLPVYGTSSLKVQDGEDPVNLLVLDGGGMRGYAHMAVIEALEELSGGQDFLSRFDLVGGTSVGGIISYYIGLETTSTKEFISNGRHMIDKCRTEFIGNVSKTQAVLTGVGVTGDNTIDAIMRKNFGDRLCKDICGQNVFALCAARYNDEENAKPFVVHNYEDKIADDGLKVSEGTSQMKLCNAMAATSALPAVVAPIKFQTEEEGAEISLVDGGVIANCPMAIAVDEARRLFPKRPIGTILSLGLRGADDKYASRVVDIERLRSPGLQYVRISPPSDIMCSTFETTVEVIDEMEKDVLKYMLDNKLRYKTLSMLLKKILPQRSRRVKSCSSEKVPQ